MTTARGPRLVTVAALVALVVSGWYWLADIVVPASAGLPFGCGSPAHPNLDGIARQVCANGLDGRRTGAAAAAVLALVLLGIATLSDRVRRRTGRDVLSIGLGAGAVLFAAGVAVLVAPLEARSADGATVVTCGSALWRTGDAFAAGLCADLPANRLATAVALGVAGVVVAAGWVWAAAARPEVDAEAGTSDEPADPATVAAPDEPTVGTVEPAGDPRVDPAVEPAVEPADPAAAVEPEDAAAADRP